MQGGEGAPWWLAVSAAALWAAREFVGALLTRKKNRSETDANIELIDTLRTGLSRMDERVRAMEAVQDRLNKRLDEEIALRMAAQEEAHQLRLRVQTLESAMRQIGAVIPPNHAA